MAEPKLSLHRKLAQVMYEAERIPKNGTAPKEMGGYKFVEVGDAADFIRKALAEKVITMMPTAVQVVAQHEGTTKSGATVMYVDLITDWTLTDGESGESITIQSFGAGADMGDKYSGKASTSAMKYALLTGFLLSTGEDSERGSLPERRPSPIAQGSLAHDRDDGSLIGTAEVGKVGSGADFELRQSPDGPVMAFRLTQGRKGWKVIAHGAMATSLATIKPVGQLVSVWGSMQDETMPIANGRTATYQVVNLERIKGPDFELPAQEAGSVPLFTDADMADVDAELAS